MAAQKKKQSASRTAKKRSSSGPRPVRQTRQTMEKNANRRIMQIGTVFICCMALAVSTIFYTMFTQKHLWSGNNALNSLIRDSVQKKIVNGVRGEILDRSNQVIARQTVAYTLAANFDTRSEEEKRTDEEYLENERSKVLRTAQETGRTEQVEAALRVADEQNAASYVEDPKQFASALKSVLGDTIDEETIETLVRNGLENGKSQIELGIGTKRIGREAKEKLEALKIPGLTFIETNTRTYPVTPFASNMIGFATYDDKAQKIIGKLGLEKTMDAYLGGEDGLEEYQATNLDQELPGSHRVLKESVNGESVKLTLDASLQQTVETYVAKTMEDSKALAAWCIVMDPETGKILSWASYPTFDQNTHLTISSFTDKISEYPVECGSVVKPLFYSIAIDCGVYPWNETYRAGEFYYSVDPSTQKITRVASQEETAYPPIRDALGKDYGTLTYAEGLAHSSNIALCELLSNYLNMDQVSRYLDAYGLYESTRIPFVNEVAGTKNISQVTDYLSSSFGQASSVTMLELCKAYTAVFNDGLMMQPYVVDSIVDSSTGRVLQKFQPQIVGTPIKAETAHRTIELMEGVMGQGMTGERFAIDGLDMALKTGTGEIYSPETGTYDKKNYTSTVLAAAPASDPKVMVLWGMQGPDYLNYSAEPFVEIMKASLKAANVNTGTDQSTVEEYQEWTSSEMPSLVSHSLDYANQRLEDKSVNIIVIGEGDTIISQFPGAGTTINSNDNVMLLTNGSERKMPDMIGWTRKDITAYWQLTGISISANGYGRTVWQSIDVDTPIQAETVIEVRLE